MCDLSPGQMGTVRRIEESVFRQRLIDLGVVEGRQIVCLGNSVWKEPKAYSVCGAVIALRRDACHGVILDEVRQWSA